MTIDERFDRLTERHEELTQTVELWISETRDRDRRLSESLDRVAAENRQVAAESRQRDRRMGEMHPALLRSGGERRGAQEEAT